MAFKGKRVQVVLDIPTLVEATVVEETDNGVVLDVDLSTAEATDADRVINANVVKQYLHKLAPDVPYPVWFGRAHLDRLTEVRPGEGKPETVTVTELPREGPIPCPHDGCGGTIVELDDGVRFNKIYMQEGKDLDDNVVSLPYAYTGDYDFETRHFECGLCRRIAIMPDGFQIEEWF